MRHWKQSLFLIYSSKCHCLSRPFLCYDTLDKKESRESPGTVPGDSFAFSWVDDTEGGMEYFIDFLIGVAVLAGLWIVISIIIIIAISWTHKW